MDWISIVKLTGMFATVVFLGFLVREIIRSIKTDKDANNRKKCDLD